MRHDLTLLALVLLTLTNCIICAQKLTVQVVSESYAPLKHVSVAIRYNFRENRTARRGEVVTVKTDASGNAVFANVRLDRGGFSVLAGNTCDVPEATPLFLLPNDPDANPSNISVTNPVFTQLSATIHVVVKQRPIAECLRWILSGGS